MQDDFVRNFWRYCSCYEITMNNAIWSAFSILGAAVNRKVYTKIGDIPIYCNLYVLLVGPPGSGKSTSRNFAATLFRRACPEIMVGASKQSHGDIIRLMATEKCLIKYKDEKGKDQIAHVLACFINEFKNFISYDIIGMLSFLTDIYDEPYLFDASTLSRGGEKVPFPSLSILACENPDILTRYIKTSMISDGFGRRVIIVLETENAESKPEVVIPDDVQQLYNFGLVKHLHTIKSIVGEYKHTPESQSFYNEWYVDNRKKMAAATEPVFQGYLRSKHTLLLKIAMLSDVAANATPAFRFTVPLLTKASAALEVLEANMPKLFVAAGRNELALPQQRIVELIERNGGEMQERVIEKLMGKDLQGNEFLSVIGTLKRIGDIREVRLKDDKAGRRILMTEVAYAKATKEGRIIVDGQPLR